MSKYIINGMYWNAGDDIYIDRPNNDDTFTVICLNEFIKTHIKENSNVTIIIDVEEN